MIKIVSYQPRDLFFLNKKNIKNKYDNKEQQQKLSNVLCKAEFVDNRCLDKSCTLLLGCLSGNNRNRNLCYFLLIVIERDISLATKLFNYENRVFLTS